MLLTNLIYFEWIYCFMKTKVVFIFKNTLSLIIPKVYFDVDCAHYSRRKVGEAQEGCSAVLWWAGAPLTAPPGNSMVPSWGLKHGCSLLGGVDNIAAQDSKFLQLIFHHGNSITLGLCLWLYVHFWFSGNVTKISLPGLVLTSWFIVYLLFILIYILKVWRNFCLKMREFFSISQTTT